MPEEHRPEQPELRGLYRHVKISVRTLDIIIVAGIAAMVLLVLWSASGGGYAVRFDARGGSDVPAQSVRYGEAVAEPAPPERNGYSFGLVRRRGLRYPVGLPVEPRRGRYDPLRPLDSGLNKGAVPKQEDIGNLLIFSGQ